MTFPLGSFPLAFVPTNLDPVHLFSILKMFSADKKRVETALESCGLKFNRVRGLGTGARARWVSGGRLFFWIWLPLGFHSCSSAPRVSPSGLMSFPWKSLSGS